MNRLNPEYESLWRCTTVEQIGGWFVENQDLLRLGDGVRLASVNLGVPVYWPSQKKFAGRMRITHFERSSLITNMFRGTGIRIAHLITHSSNIRANGSAFETEYQAEVTYEISETDFEAFSMMRRLEHPEEFADD